MNKFKSVFLVILAVVATFSMQAQAPMPLPAPGNFQPPMGFPFGAEGMPKMTEEDIKAFQEAQEMINNMKPEELEEVFKVIEGVLSGEIDPAEVFGPMPTQPAPKPQPPQPKPEEKVEPQPAPQACVVEKQVALRNKNAAQAMINTLLEHIAAIRVKASTDSKVADSLTPWNSSLDSLTYYLHIIVQKHHIESLVCEQDFLSLHDALKQLHDVLVKNEPQLKTRELGIETQDPAIKERSKKALATILQSFEVAFKQQNILDGLEKLLKKYEPELLKKRKEMEAQEERAKKESETMKSWQPTPSRIKPEAEYTPRGDKFFDWLYDTERRGRPSRPHEAPRRIEEKPTPSKEATPPSVGKGGKAGEGEKDKGGKKSDKGTEAGKGDKGAAKKYEPKNKEEIRLDKHLDELEDIFDEIVSSYLNTPYLLGKPGIVSYLPLPFTTREDVDKNVNKPLDETAAALHTIGKKKGDIEAKMKKASEEGAKSYKSRLKKIVEDAQSKLQPIYNSLLTQLRLIKDNQTYGRMSADKIYVLTGYKNVAGSPKKELVEAAEQPTNHVDNFMTAYEIVFKPGEAKVRTEISEALAKKDSQEPVQKKATPKKRLKPKQLTEEEPTIPEIPEVPQLPEALVEQEPFLDQENALENAEPSELTDADLL